MTDLIKKYSLNNSTWTYKGFHAVLHTFFPCIQTGQKMNEFFKDHAKITLLFVKDNYVHWYWHDKELTRLRNIFFKRLKENKNYLEEIKVDWYKKISIFEKIIAKVKNLDKLSNKELKSLYAEFYNAYIDEFAYFMVIGDAISMPAEKYLIPQFKKVLRKNFDKEFPKLLKTRYLSFIEEENIDRAKLLKIYIKKGKIPEYMLETHSKKYFYIHNNYAKAVYLTAKDFEKIIKKEKTVSNIVEEPEKIPRFKFNQWQKTLLYIMDEFFKIQDTRKKYVLISNYYQFEFLRELSKRTKIPFRDLQYSIYPEFDKILDKEFDTSILKQRNNLSICISTKKGYEIVHGKEAEKVFKFFKKDSNKKIIKGLTASLGKVQGRVRKILKIHDMANMEKGDILVTSMTRPEMVPAMKLAGAIVTDEGGITSHASIISRELGIPCIIGTKIATSSLNDGDLVEVDADKGIVRILDK